MIFGMVLVGCPAPVAISGEMPWFGHAQRSERRALAPSHPSLPSKLDRNRLVVLNLPDPMMRVLGPDRLQSVSSRARMLVEALWADHA